jgi:hypothetical protein
MTAEELHKKTHYRKMKELCNQNHFLFSLVVTVGEKEI